MASSKGYLDFILEQLSELDDVTYRAMMDYKQERIMTLGELTPEWWIG
jgi:TfoX/Sxy family transcriptional regulator of competence genes